MPTSCRLTATTASDWSRKATRSRAASRSPRWDRARARATNCISKYARTASRSTRSTTCRRADHVRLAAPAEAGDHALQPEHRAEYSAQMGLPTPAEIDPEDLIELIDAIEPQD